MIFSNAAYLWWLLLVIAGIFLEIFLYKKRQELLGQLFPNDLKALMLRHWDSSKHIFKIALFIAAIFFLVLALARPQWDKKEAVSGRQGIDIIFAIDTSRSMLAKDLPPNRLENAKASLALLLDQLAGNRVGLVAFAGTSFIQCPLTNDIDTIKLFLSSIDTELIPNPGTNIGKAINTAIKAFGKSSNSKAIIMLTDGEELDGSAIAAADNAAKNKISIYAVGIGSLDGATIPALDKDGKENGVKKDDDGNVILTRTNPELLEILAKKTKGKAFMITEDQSGFQKLFAAISSLPKQHLKNSLAFQYHDRFQIFIFLSLACLITEMLISERRDEK